MFIENPVLIRTRAPAERNVSGNSTQFLCPFRSAGARKLLEDARSINIPPLTGGETWVGKMLLKNKKINLCTTEIEQRRPGMCFQTEPRNMKGDL